MTFAAYLGIASGIALVLTGIGLGIARPRRVAGWFFAAFVAVWGAETVLFNSLGLVGSLATILLLERVAFALILVEVLFLVHFTVRFTGGLGTRVAWWSWGAAAHVLVAGVLLSVDPSLFSEPAGPTFLATLLVNVPKFAVLFVTLGILAARYRSHLYEHQHRELRIVLAGLGFYAAYTAGFYIVFYGNLMRRASGSPDPSILVFLVLFFAATLYVLYLTVRFARPTSEGSREGGPDLELTAALAVPLVAGVATSLAEALAGWELHLFGLLRIGSALVIAYGLLKFEIFDIDRKVKIGIERSTILGAFGVAFLVASETVELLLGIEGEIFGVGAAVVIGLFFRRVEQGAEAVADRIMPGVEDTPAYREQRKVEIYQAAVERAAGDEMLTERERGILAGLREELDIDADTARSIESRLGAPVSR